MGVLHGPGGRVENTFGLLGRDEEAGTNALGFVLAFSSALRRRFLEHLLGRDLPDAKVAVQRSTPIANDGGKRRIETDIEIWDGSGTHVIVEAKLRLDYPSREQLSKYTRAFFDPSSGRAADDRHMVVLNAAKEEVIRPMFNDRKALLGEEGITTHHISWGKVQELCKRAGEDAEEAPEKSLLEDLENHLKHYILKVPEDRVYVVPINAENLSQPGFWKGEYSHPVGGEGNWPRLPSDLIGFRWGGWLRGVFPTRWEVVEDDKGTPWISYRFETEKPKYYFDFREARVENDPRNSAHEIRNGRKFSNRAKHHYFALETLTSGEHATLVDALEATKRIWAERGERGGEGEE